MIYKAQYRSTLFFGILVLTHTYTHTGRTEKICDSEEGSGVISVQEHENMSNV